MTSNAAVDVSWPPCRSPIDVPEAAVPGGTALPDPEGEEAARGVPVGRRQRMPVHGVDPVVERDGDRHDERPRVAGIGNAGVGDQGSPVAVDQVDRREARRRSAR